MANEGWTNDDRRELHLMRQEVALVNAIELIHTDPVLAGGYLKVALEETRRETVKLRGVREPSATSNGTGPDVRPWWSRLLRRQPQQASLPLKKGRA